MASIKKRTTTSGEHRYDVRYRDPSGRVRTKTFRRRKDADTFANTTETDKVRGTWIDPTAGRIAFKDYADQWIRERTTRRSKRLAPRTVQTYRYLLHSRILPTFGTTELAAIKVPQVRTWHSQMVATGYPTATAKAYRLLRAILNTAVEDEIILRNPCNIRDAGNEHSPERPIATAQEVWDLADAIDDRLRAFVLVAAFVGLRFSEIAGLERRHVNVLHGTLEVDQQLEIVSKVIAEELGIETQGFGPPKSDAGYRTLVVPEPAMAELVAHLDEFTGPEPDALVFVGERGAAWSNSRFNKRFRKAKQAAGVPAHLRLHDLRHTHMTAAAESGASTKELMRRLGQSSAAAALRYQHATKRRDAEIADSVGRSLARPEPAPEDQPRDGRAIDDIDKRRGA